MAKFFIETQCWEHWPKVLVMGRNRNDGTVERRRYVPERMCTVEKFEQNPSYGDYYCELSCGCWFDVVDDTPPAYCPICGQKLKWD
jgi:hypothetical protein